jgi:hypothetical protein
MPTKVGSPSPDPAAALKAAVIAYSDAFLGGNGEAAWRLLSARCRDRLPRDTFVQGVTEAHRLYGTLPIRSLRVDALSGDLARVSYTFSSADLNQDHEPWVREAGAWHEDDC